MDYRILIKNTGEEYSCNESSSLLAAMERLRRHGIPVGCRNGGCGVCKIQIESGRFVTGKMSRSVVSEADELRGCVLACKTHPQSDLQVQVVGKMVKGFEKDVARAASTGFSFDFGLAGTGTAKRRELKRTGSKNRRDLWQSLE